MSRDAIAGWTRRGAHRLGLWAARQPARLENTADLKLFHRELHVYRPVRFLVIASIFSCPVDEAL